MSNQYFKFKRFTIFHDKCAMKVGTDAVLLGAWCEVSNRKKALDIGTGTGILSLMIAQRNQELSIVAIDIDNNSITQAKENVSNSEFADRITIQNKDFSDMDILEKFDLIVCNPPFYEEHTFCPDNNRNKARHTNSLPFDTLITKVEKTLAEDGIFSVIIPSSSTNKFIEKCKISKLYLRKRTDVYTCYQKEAKRSLLEFSRNCCSYYESNNLYIRKVDGEYSEEYIKLTKDFYLNL